MKRNKWMMASLLAAASSAIVATGAFAKDNDNEGAYVAPPSAILGKTTAESDYVYTIPAPQAATSPAAAASAASPEAAQSPGVYFFAPPDKGESDQ